MVGNGKKCFGWVLRACKGLRKGRNRMFEELQIILSMVGTYREKVNNVTWVWRDKSNRVSPCRVTRRFCSLIKNGKLSVCFKNWGRGNGVRMSSDLQFKKNILAAMCRIGRGWVRLWLM